MNEFLPDPPQVGALVRVRSRQYLVEDRVEPPLPGQATIVRMSCLDHDPSFARALRLQLEALISREFVRRLVITKENAMIGSGGPDE